MHVYTEGNTEWISKWWAKGRSSCMSGPSKGGPGCTLKMHSDESLSKTVDGFVSADVLGLGYSTLSSTAATVKFASCFLFSVCCRITHCITVDCGVAPSSLLIQNNGPFLPQVAQGATVYMKDWPASGWRSSRSHNPQVPHEWFAGLITCGEQIQTSLGVLCRSV